MEEKSEMPVIDVEGLLTGEEEGHEIASALATAHTIDYEDPEDKEEKKGAYDSITYDDP